MGGGKDADHAKIASDPDEFVKFVHQTTNRDDFKILEILSVGEYKCALIQNNRKKPLIFVTDPA